MFSSTKWILKSREYEILCKQIFNSSLNILKKNIKNNKNPAIVMDIDETVLNNITFQIENKGNFCENKWEKWVLKEKCTLIPGVKSYISEIRKLDIQIIYISNRKHDLLIPTINNFKKLKIYNYNDIFLLQANIQDTKEIRRKEIKNKIGRMKNFPEFNVLQYLGDQYEDFESLDSELFGFKNFLLPNPVYFKL